MLNLVAAIAAFHAGAPRLAGSLQPHYALRCYLPPRLCSIEQQETSDSAKEPIDPRKAVEEVGVLLEEVKLLWTEGSTWSPEERCRHR